MAEVPPTATSGIEFTENPIKFEPPPTNSQDDLKWIIPVAVLVPTVVIVVIIVTVIICLRRKKSIAKSKITKTELHRLSRIDRARHSTGLQYSDSLRVQPLRVNLPPHCARGPGSRATYCLANEIAEDVSGGYSPLSEFDTAGIPAPKKGATAAVDNESEYDLIPSDVIPPMTEDDEYDHIPPPNVGATKIITANKVQDGEEMNGLVASGGEYDHIPSATHTGVNTSLKGSAEIMMSGDEYDLIPSAASGQVKVNTIKKGIDDEYDHIPNVINANVKVINKSSVNAKTPGLTSDDGSAYNHIMTNGQAAAIMTPGDEYDHIPNVKPPHVTVIKTPEADADTTNLMISGDEYDHIPATTSANVTVIKTPEADADTTNLMASGDEYDHIPVTTPANVTVVSKSQDVPMETDCEYDHIPIAPPTEVTVVKKPHDDDDDDADDDDDNDDDDDDDEVVGQMIDEAEYDHIPGTIPAQVMAVTKPVDKGVFVGKPRFLVKDEGGGNDESDTEEADNDDDDEDEDEEDNPETEAMDDEGQLPDKVLESRRSTKSTRSAKVLVADNTLYEETRINAPCGSPPTGDKVVTPKVLVNDNNLYEGLPEPSTPVIDPNNPANNPTMLSAQKYSTTYSNCTVSEGGRSSQGENKGVSSLRHSGGTNKTRDESFGYLTDDDSVFYRSHEYLNDDVDDIFVDLEEGGDRGEAGGELPRTAKVLVEDNELYSSSESDVEESIL